MKHLFLASLIVLFSGNAPVQQDYLGSLHHLANNAKKTGPKF